MIEIFSSNVDEYGYKVIIPRNHVVAVNNHKVQCLKKLETHEQEIIKFLARTDKYLNDIHKLRILYYNKLDTIASEKRKLV